MKHLLIVAAALVGFAATAQASVQSCTVIGYIENAESGAAPTPIYSNDCRPVTSGYAVGVRPGNDGGLEVEYDFSRPGRPVLGGDLTQSDYWTYFPTAAAARAHCNVRDNVVYDYWYRAFRCQEAGPIQGND